MEDNPGRSDDASDSDSARRPSLAERLMNPQQRAATASLDRPAAEPAPAPSAVEERPLPVAPSAALRSAAPAFAQATNPAGQSLKEARRMIRLRYLVFLASMFVLFATMVAATIALAVFALGDGRWEELAASGAIAGAALLLLVLLQYRPIAGYATAASELTRLEALSTHLEKSYALWDGFLEQKRSSQQVGANDVALAVSSMTAATRDMVSLQAELLRTRGGASTPPATQLGSFPTPTSPDPRRYKRGVRHRRPILSPYYGSGLSRRPQNHPPRHRLEDAACITV